jgi:hypothetical protein
MTSDIFSADDAFWNELDARIGAAGGSILLLERWARGAGQRSWFLLTRAGDVDAARNAVRPGSSLTAYFRPDLPVHGAWSEELGRETKVLIDGLGPNEELVGLVDRGARPMVEAEYLANAGELTSWAPAVMGDTIWIGKYPDWPPDGEDAITRVVPDADGVVRSHPY